MDKNTDVKLVLGRFIFGSWSLRVIYFFYPVANKMEKKKYLPEPTLTPKTIELKSILAR